MIVVQFTGEGRGFNAGVSEIIQVFEEFPEEGLEDYTPPGFAVANIHRSDDDFPAWFPYERTLVVRP